MPLAAAPSAVRAHQMGAGEWGFLLFLALIWGASFYFNALALGALPVFSIVALRVAIGAGVLLAVLWLSGAGLRLTPRLAGTFLLMGLINNVIPFTLIVWGQTAIASGVAAILNATTPLFSVAFVWAFGGGGRPARLALWGLPAGLAGVAVMAGPDAVALLGRDLAAQAACLGAACSYALAGVWGRRLGRAGVTPLPAATGQLVASALILAPVALLVDAPWRLALPGGEVWLALAALGAVSTALAYVIYFRLLASAGPTNLLLVTFLVPVTAIVLGVVLLGEVLAPRHLAGMALIGVGLALIDGRLPARLSAVGRGRRHG